MALQLPLVYCGQRLTQLEAFSEITQAIEKLDGLLIRPLRVRVNIIYNGPPEVSVVLLTQTEKRFTEDLEVIFEDVLTETVDGDVLQLQLAKMFKRAAYYVHRRAVGRSCAMTQDDSTAPERVFPERAYRVMCRQCIDHSGLYGQQQYD